MRLTQPPFPVAAQVRFLTNSGLYLHIPFCDSKCRYCSFYSLTANEDKKAEYTQALCREIEKRGGKLTRPFHSLYIGGGTPSALGSELLCEIIKTALDSFNFVEDAEIKMPFEQAYELVIEGLAPLGKDYQDLLRKAKADRWIDVCENEGKRSGAYSTGSYDTHPYVLLNYQQTTNDIFTIAHEMGHAIHTYQSSDEQPYEKSQYTIFLAEIASTVNEVFLLKHLYKNTDDKSLKRYLLTYYMDMIRATMFRQTQFAEFEQQAHAMVERGEPLTKDNLCELYYDLNKAYYGDGIIHDKQISYEWARIPHFYNSFYVYKYATGIISAISIVRSILSGEEGAVERYFTFLRSGGKTDPVTILQGAGVDLTTKAPFEAAMQEFKDTFEEFKKLSK